jgi:hypothetical protein
MKHTTISDAGKADANSSPKTDGSADGSTEGKPSGVTALIAETEALRTLLREAHQQASPFLVHIKRHRKQALAVQATLASLRHCSILRHDCRSQVAPTPSGRGCFASSSQGEMQPCPCD